MFHFNLGDFQVPGVEPGEIFNKGVLDFKRPSYLLTVLKKSLWSCFSWFSLELVVAWTTHQYWKKISTSHLDHFSPSFWEVKFQEDDWKIQKTPSCGFRFGFLGFWGIPPFFQAANHVGRTLETRFPHHRRSFCTRSWVACGARSSWLATLDAVLPAGGGWRNGMLN